MITVEHLTKYYGDFMAVNDLSFEIEDGHVYGFLGPNGAGKSTTMNIMTGCLSATDGRVLIDGYDIFEEPLKAKKLIGYLPEIPPLYTNETPMEYLKFVGAAKGLKGSRLKQQIEEVIKETRLEDKKDKLISTLSKGYKQRVGIAQALIGNPRIIILDEPTIGLDPNQIIEIRDLIRQLGETHTVILSSHILSEVQEVCERVLIINKGKLVAFDAQENLEKHFLASSGITFVAEAVKEDVDRVLSNISQITEWECTPREDETIFVSVATGDTDSREIRKLLFSAFAAEEIIILEMAAKKANLEDIFIELTKEDVTADVTDGDMFDDETAETEQAENDEAAENEQAENEETKESEVDE